MKTQKALFSLVMVGLFVLASIGAASAQDTPQPEVLSTEVVSPYLTEVNLVTADGKGITASIINGPSEPPVEFEAERQASIQPLPSDGIIANFPSFSWVFGCSAVSGAMIATYYDRNGKANMYTGPTAGGVMPLSDTSWPSWSDGYKTYPNNPLIASKMGVDGRTTKGSINDYWIKYGSTAADPYVGHWTQHTWGTAIGDYMKTSQSAYSNTDGSSMFYNWTSSSTPLTCADMVTNNIHGKDATYGRKLFYEKRGYTVTDCYNQKTDNNGGGFTLAKFQAEINANRPVMINVVGHTMVGYGYSGSTIYIRDTWDNNTSHTYTMPWGGSYSGMAMRSVSIVNLSGGTPPTGGFNSQFNGSMKGWAKKGTVPWSVNSSSMYSAGTANKWSQAYWTGNQFSNFTYSAKLKRGASSTSANTLFVRMGSTVGTGYLANMWTPGYYFEYTNSGSFSVWQINSPTTMSYLQYWTSTSAIKKNNWNELKVIANGSSLKYYINGTLVYSGTNSYRSSGYVGVGFADNGDAGDTLYVDWAKLSKLSAKYENNDVVSPEQQALNDAAELSAPLGDVNGLFK